MSLQEQKRKQKQNQEQIQIQELVRNLSDRKYVAEKRDKINIAPEKLLAQFKKLLYIKTDFSTHIIDKHQDLEDDLALGAAKTKDFLKILELLNTYKNGFINLLHLNENNILSPTSKTNYVLLTALIDLTIGLVESHENIASVMFDEHAHYLNKNAKFLTNMYNTLKPNERTEVLKMVEWLPVFDIDIDFAKIYLDIFVDSKMYLGRACHSRSKACNRWSKDELLKIVGAYGIKVNSKISIDELCKIITEFESTYPEAHSYYLYDCHNFVGLKQTEFTCWFDSVLMAFLIPNNSRMIFAPKFSRKYPQFNTKKFAAQEHVENTYGGREILVNDVCFNYREQFGQQSNFFEFIPYLLRQLNIHYQIFHFKKNITFAEMLPGNLNKNAKYVFFIPRDKLWINSFADDLLTAKDGRVYELEAILAVHYRHIYSYIKCNNEWYIFDNERARQGLTLLPVDCRSNYNGEHYFRCNSVFKYLDANPSRLEDNDRRFMFMYTKAAD